MAPDTRPRYGLIKTFQRQVPRFVKICPVIKNLAGMAETKKSPAIAGESTFQHAMVVATC